MRVRVFIARWRGGTVEPWWYGCIYTGSIGSDDNSVGVRESAPIGRKIA